MIDWFEYEQKKNILREENLIPEEYEKRIEKIIKELERENNAAIRTV